MSTIPSWTIIVIALSCFTGLFMLVTFYILAETWRRYRTGSSSPSKFTYSAQKRSGNDDQYPVPLSNRAWSLSTLNAHQTDLAVEAERDARQIIEKSSMFEYWWEEGEETPGLKGKNISKSTSTKKATGRFSTHPQYHGSSTKKDGNMTLVEKVVIRSNTDGKQVVSKHVNGDVKGDLKL